MPRDKLVYIDIPLLIEGCKSDGMTKEDIAILSMNILKQQKNVKGVD